MTRGVQILSYKIGQVRTGGWGSCKDGPALQKGNLSIYKLINRATALTEGAITSWISKVSTIVMDAGLSEMTTEELAQRMWNCDETAFATDVASKRILARRGEKNIHETSGGSEGNI